MADLPHDVTDHGVVTDWRGDPRAWLDSGDVVAQSAQQEHVVDVLRVNGLALSAGVTLYVGMSNLVPEFRARGGWRLPVAFVGGTATYAIVRAIASV